MDDTLQILVVATNNLTAATNNLKCLVKDQSKVLSQIWKAAMELKNEKIVPPENPREKKMKAVDMDMKVKVADLIFF